MLVGKANRGKTTLLEKISEKGQRGIKDNWGNNRSHFHSLLSLCLFSHIFQSAVACPLSYSLFLSKSYPLSYLPLN